MKLKFDGYYDATLFRKGGMGKLYLAFSVVTHERCVIKTIRHPDKVTRGRFSREISLLNRLRNDPHFVQIIEDRQQGERPFYAMEYIDGGSLADICQTAPIEPRRLARLMSDPAAGLARIHALRYLHRDFKPDNILWNRKTDRLVIADLGLVKPLEERNQTNDKQVLGTPLFTDPVSQAIGSRSATEMTDFFAFGQTLFCAAYKSMPNATHTVQCWTNLVTAALTSTSEEPQVSPLTVSGQLQQAVLKSPIPWQLQAIIARCLSLDVERQYPSANAICSDLQAYANDGLLDKQTHRTYWALRGRLLLSRLSRAFSTLLPG